MSPPADGRKSGIALALEHAVLSPDLLAANIDALTNAQGFCPNLGALPDTLRVAAVHPHVCVELRGTDHGWSSIDFAEAGSPEATAWLDTARGAGITQIILAGAGLGHAIDAAGELGLSHILLIEPDPGIATLLLSRRDWRDWISRGHLRLITGPDYRGAGDIARFFDGLRDVAVVTHPLRTRIDPQQAALATAVGERVANNTRANGEARRRFAGPYLLQSLTNLPAIAQAADVDALRDTFRGVPAIVCGAGPSLDDNIASLRRAAGRAVIVAADTALGPLRSAGIAPHLVVAADSSALNARHVTSVRGTDEVMLVAEGSVHPSTFAAFAGRAFVFRVSEHEPWPWLATAGISRGELRTWGSVLTSAFDLARRMGCHPIVFAGADLAFTGGRPYCRGTIYDAMWQEWIDKGCTWDQMMADYFSRQPEVWLEDVRGARVRTAPHLVSFRNWLVEQAAATSGTTFINATGGGILHGGVIAQRALSDLVDGWPREVDVRAALRVRHTAATATGTDVQRLNQLLADAATSPSCVPVERWCAFAASTVTTGDILGALPATAA